MRNSLGLKKSAAAQSAALPRFTDADRARLLKLLKAKTGKNNAEIERVLYYLEGGVWGAQVARKQRTDALPKKDYLKKLNAVEKAVDKLREAMRALPRLGVLLQHYDRKLGKPMGSNRSEIKFALENLANIMRDASKMRDELVFLQCRRAKKPKDRHVYLFAEVCAVAWRLAGKKPSQPWSVGDSAGTLQDTDFSRFVQAVLAAKIDGADLTCEAFLFVDREADLENICRRAVESLRKPAKPRT